MKKKVGIIINCIWIAILVAIGVTDCWHGYLNPAGYVSDTHMVHAEPFLYATDNSDGTAKLYRIADDGEVTTVVEADGAGNGYRCAGILAGQNISVLMEGWYTEDGVSGNQYRIVEYTQDLTWILRSLPIRLEGYGRLTGFSADDGGYYLTTVDGNGKSASVYRIPREESQNTAEETEKTEEPLTVEQVTMTATADGRAILQARYQRGKMLLYLDDGSGAENFVPDAEMIALFQGRHCTVRQYLGSHMELIFRYVVILFSGLLLLVIVENILRKKSRLICMIAAMEAVLLLLVAGNVLFAFCMEYRKEADKCKELSTVYLKEMADNEAFQEAVPEDMREYHTSGAYYKQDYEMKKLLYGKDVSAYFREVCLVRVNDGTIIAGTGIWNGRPIAEIYTDAAQQLAICAVNEGKYLSAEVKIGEREYFLGSMPTAQDGYALMGVLSTDFILYQWRDVLIRDSLVGLVVYVILSVLGIAFLTAQSRDIEKLRNVMLRVAGGSEDIERPDVHGKDMESMWNSINETDKTLKKMNYSKLQIFEAYYRFAPKNIEKLLEKNSIMEVASGDERRLAGNMAIVGIDPAGKDTTLENRNRFLEALERRQRKQGGITVSSDARLSVLKLLFPTEKGDTVQFAVDLIRDFPENACRNCIPATVFLFHSQFIYGVAGTETQCFPFLDTRDEFHQDEYAAWFGTMGLRIVVTEEIMQSGCGDKDTRYLGYISANSGQVKLYEVLDACPNRERMAKLRTKEKFEQALQLFYQYDFYLARSTFSELLRELPDDRIAKWYLFTCEKHLNEVHGETIDCGLHYD